MKKTHKLFLIQIAIGITLFIILAGVTKMLFYNDSDIKSYLYVDEGVKEMAGTTEDLLNDFIVKKDVTFDPTSGKQIEKVLNNLKITKKEKFLFIGSSQLCVIQGQKINNSYKNLVNIKFEKYSSKDIQSYNLSLGGMTVTEKIILAKKASEILKPENILVAVTPWDSQGDKIRPEITAIENQTFSNQEASKDFKQIFNNNLTFPLNLNDKINNNLERIVDRNLTIYSKRTVIKQWLNDEIKSVSALERDSMNRLTKAPPKFSRKYWLTVNQELNNNTAWENMELGTEEATLKIINTKSSEAKWYGEEISLSQPTNTLMFSGSSKADSVSVSTKLYAIDYLVTFEDNTTQWYVKNLIFNKGTHDWQHVQSTATFDKAVVSIKPHLLFYGGTGTVWFKDLKAFQVLAGVKQEILIPKPDEKIVFEERENVSYTYNAKDWNKIKENIFSTIDYLKSSSVDNKYLLLTPFWYTDKKTTYPQKLVYRNLVNDIETYCEKNGVKLIDASYILDKSNFGVYKNGSVKDKIDVLHFDAEGHEILAKFIIKHIE